MSENQGNAVIPPTETGTGNGGGTTDTDSNTGASTGRVQRQSNTRPFIQNIKKTGSKPFIGDTAKMNGHVFQLHSERKNKSQFGDTVKALRVYSSETFKNDIEALTVLFTDLVEPVLTEPEDPVEVTTTRSDGTTVKTISKFEEMKYAEKVKQWIRDDKSLKC